MHTRSVLIAVPLLALLGCGGGGAGGSSPATSGGASAVNAQEREFAISLNPTSVAAGPTTFHVTNNGSIVHEFVVIDTDTPAAQLPQVNGAVDEDSLEVVDEIEEVAVGATSDLSVNLQPGHYAVICNIPGHYAGGMHADLTVQ